MHRSLSVVRMKTASALLGLARQAKTHRKLLLTGRTHNVPAQPTTLGKRIAMAGQELLLASTRLAEITERYPARGLKGAVGTQLDQFTLLGGSASKVAKLEARVLKHLGFKAALNAVGQVYPRSLDFEVVSALHQVGAAAASFATTLRRWRARAFSPRASKRAKSARPLCRTRSTPAIASASAAFPRFSPAMSP